MPKTVKPVRNFSDATLMLAQAEQLQYNDGPAALRLSRAVLDWSRQHRAQAMQAKAGLAFARASLWGSGVAAAIDTASEALSLFDALADETGAIEALSVLSTMLQITDAYATSNGLIEQSLRERRCSELDRANLLRHRAAALAQLGELDLARSLMHESVLPGLRNSGNANRVSVAWAQAAFIEQLLELHASNITSVATLNRRPSVTGAPGAHLRLAHGYLNQAEAATQDFVSLVTVRTLRAMCRAFAGEAAAAKEIFSAVLIDTAASATKLRANVLRQYAFVLRVMGEDAGAREQLAAYAALRKSTGEELCADSLFEYAILAERAGAVADAAMYWREFSRVRMAWSAATVAWFDEFARQPALPAAQPSNGITKPSRRNADVTEPAFVQAFHHLVASQGYNRRTVPWFCKSLGVSRTVLESALAKHRDTTPLAVIKQHRMTLAARMLATTGTEIADIAECLGYSSPSRLSADFRVVFLMTPTAYRAGNVRR